MNKYGGRNGTGPHCVTKQVQANDGDERLKRNRSSENLISVTR